MDDSESASTHHGSFVRLGSLPAASSESNHHLGRHSLRVQRTQSTKNRGSYLGRMLQRFSRPASVDMETAAAIPSVVVVDHLNNISHHPPTVTDSKTTSKLQSTNFNPEVNLTDPKDHGCSHSESLLFDESRVLTAISKFGQHVEQNEDAICAVCATEMTTACIYNSEATSSSSSLSPKDVNTASFVSSNSRFSFCSRRHSACLQCWRDHVTSRIEGFRMTKMTCIACELELDFEMISVILSLGYFSTKKVGAKLLKRYDRFIFHNCIVREPDLRWCPGGCGYAVIAPNCQDCPLLYCLRPGCQSMFCYHCRSFWHPGTCVQNSKSRRERGLMNDDGIRVTAGGDSEANGKTKRRTRRRFFWNRRNQKKNSRESASHQQAIMTDEGEVKNCPRCQTFVVKANDGSCNHMSCLVCGCEFCWLCLQEVTDMHFLSVSGCTFWGKKQWRPSKRIFWQLGTLLVAPIGVAFLGAVAIPTIIVGVPYLIASKVYSHFKPANPHKRRAVTVFAALGGFLLSPLIAALVVGLGIPTILAYIYIVMPFLMLRSCSCWNTCCPLEEVEDGDNDEEDQMNAPELFADNIKHFGARPVEENGEEAVAASTHTVSISQQANGDVPNGDLKYSGSSLNKITVDVDINVPVCVKNSSSNDDSSSLDMC